MNIIGELSEIAAAKYGLQLKDPIFKAFDKLVTDPKFELIKDLVDDDFEDFKNAILSYQSNNTATKTLRNILNLIYILNGRKGFEAKRMVGHVIPEKEHIAYWIDMLAKELLNSSNNNQNDGVAIRGSGVINGIKMRAAIYHILDILQFDGAIYNDSWVVTLASPCCVFGRGVYCIVISGTSAGVGYYNPEDEKYYVDVTLRDMFQVYGLNETYTIEIGDEPLGEGDSVTFDIPNGQNLTYSLYSLAVVDFPTDVQLFYIATKERSYVPGAVREKTGMPPFSIYTVDTSLLDWSITAISDKVGKLGKNYLKPKTTAIPNGCEGTFLSTAFSYTDAEPGYTFNSGNATRLYISFKRPSDANIVAADTGNLMLVEGSTIPATYDADTNLYKHGFLQGSSETHDGAANSGVTQIIFDNEDEYGRSNNYNNADGRTIRCKTYPITLEPNTYYSVKLFNSSYTGVQMSGVLMTEPGTITPQFETLSNQKSIPGNETFVANTEQWENLAYSHYRTKSWRPNVAIDIRPMHYEFCEYYADLKAGTYKLMYDAWGNNNMGSDWVGFQTYSGCFEDNWDSEQSNKYEWFALVTDDNTQIVGKTRLFPASMDGNDGRRSKTAPFPNYYHGEVEFTLTEDTKVGLIHKAYYTAISYANPPYFRFYIVDADEEAEEFTTTDCSPTNMSGYSAWEKYKVTVDIHIYPEDRTTHQAVRINLDDVLNEGDVISLTSSGINIPTYEGWNTIEFYGDGDVVLYVKYQQ